MLLCIVYYAVKAVKADVYYGIEIQMEKKI
jgi:hypothetical protein